MLLKEWGMYSKRCSGTILHSRGDNLDKDSNLKLGLFFAL